MLYSYTDAVNLLYVAFTRAENELIAFSSVKKPNPKKKNDNSVKNTSDVLYQIINQSVTTRVGEQERTINLSDFYDKETQIFDFSVNHKTEKKAIITDSQNTDFNKDLYPNNRWQNKLKLKFSSEDFLIESIPEIEDKVNHGKLMHLIFQNINTAEDVEKSVMMQHYEGLLTLDEAKELKEGISDIITDENVKHWFDGSYKVLNEDALLTEKGTVRIPDRVLFSEEKLIVIDFKFGKHHKKYKNQLDEYRHLLEDLYKLPVQSFLYYPENKKIIEVTEDSK